MHQPEVPHLSQGLSLLWLLACRSPEPPPEPSAPQTMLWRLGGRVTHNRSAPDAPPFAGGADLLAHCGEVRPCAAELWRTESGETATLLVQGDRVVWEADGGTWPARWKRLGTELTWCLSHEPLASPPGGDPGAFRVLTARAPPAQDRSAAWVLHFSGDNPCQLSGELILSAARDRADSRDLHSGGKLWREGGRENALGILQARQGAQEAP